MPRKTSALAGDGIATLKAALAFGGAPREVDVLRKELSDLQDVVRHLLDVTRDRETYSKRAGTLPLLLYLIWVDHSISVQMIGFLLH